jgi:AcrR family transcriptional regulator
MGTESTAAVAPGGDADEARTERARALLDAAEALLEEAGVEALSARTVAERAGVNKGLVFYYWGSTHGLFEQVLERYYERHKASLEAAFDAEGSLRERVHHVMDEYLDFMEENGTYARVVQQQVASRGPHLSLVEKHLTEVLGLTARMLADVTPSDGPLSARHFHLSISAVVINYFTYGPVLRAAFPGGDPLAAAALAERRAHVHWVVDAWLDGLERAAAG